MPQWLMKAAVAERVLRGYRGLLQSDGYQIYDGLTQAVHAGCMAHARRYFIDEVKLNPGDGIAVPLVERLDALFAVERRAREDGLSLEERHELRQRESRGMIDELKEELERVKHDVLPQSQNGKGIHYALAQWEKLTRFLDHPELELSNNLAERAMRGAAIGRKNWLHVGSPAAGPRVAAILSVVESATFCPDWGIANFPRSRSLRLRLGPGGAPRWPAECDLGWVCPNAYRSLIPDGVSSGFITRMENNITPEELESRLSRCKFSIIQSDVPLILGDSPCVFETRSSRRFSPVIGDRNELIGAYLPISAHRAIVGGDAPVRAIDADIWNLASARCSDEFFISSCDRPELNSLNAEIGKWSGLLSKKETEAIRTKLRTEILREVRHYL